jgi:hypothetical protein
MVDDSVNSGMKETMKSIPKSIDQTNIKEAQKKYNELREQIEQYLRVNLRFFSSGFLGGIMGPMFDRIKDSLLNNTFTNENFQELEVYLQTISRQTTNTDTIQRSQEVIEAINVMQDLEDLSRELSRANKIAVQALGSESPEDIELAQRALQEYQGLSDNIEAAQELYQEILRKNLANLSPEEINFKNFFEQNILPTIKAANNYITQMQNDGRFESLDFSGVLPYIENFTFSDVDFFTELTSETQQEDQFDTVISAYSLFYLKDPITQRLSEILMENNESRERIVNALRESNDLDKEVEQRIERIREFNQQIEEFVQGQIEANQQQIEQFLNNYRIQITEMIDYLINVDRTLDEEDKASLIEKLSYFQEMYLDAILGPRNKTAV